MTSWTIDMHETYSRWAASPQGCSCCTSSGAQATSGTRVPEVACAPLTCTTAAIRGQQVLDGFGFLREETCTPCTPSHMSTPLLIENIISYLSHTAVAGLHSSLTRRDASMIQIQCWGAQQLCWPVRANHCGWMVPTYQRRVHPR
jgi:hypothetical protein